MIEHATFPSGSKMTGETTYPRPNLKDFTLNDNNLEQACPLDNGRHVIDQDHDLGVLEKLPLELLHSILVGIDIRSLTDFRRVNKRAMQVVDSISAYQSILRHSPASIRGILSTGIGSHISCQRLIDALNEPRCESCGDFGGYIYLLTCRRVCFLCFYEKQDYFPLLISEAERKYGVPRRLLTSLPSVRSIPGRYAPNKYSCKTRLTLIHSEAAHCMGLEHHGSTQVMEQFVAGAAQRKLETHRQRTEGQAGSTSSRPPRTDVQEGRMADQEDSWRLWALHG